MVNKLLGIGLVAIVALGSIGVWKLADGGDRRAAALGDDKPLSEGPSGALHWRGAFNSEAAYKAMDVVSYEGSSWIAAADSEKTTVPPEEPWDLLAQGGESGAQGLQGPAGTFSGTLKSPNGKYSLVVADDGIVMQGPGGSVKLRDVGIEVIADRSFTVRAGQDLMLNSSAAATVKTGAGMTVEAGAVLHLKGSIIKQN